jgi:hypothetical protein
MDPLMGAKYNLQIEHNFAVKQQTKNRMTMQRQLNEQHMCRTTKKWF